MNNYDIAILVNNAATDCPGPVCIVGGEII
jgi:short-subunit dehydrogenase